MKLPMIITSTGWKYEKTTLKTTMERDPREVAELAASLATKRAEEAPCKGKGMTLPSKKLPDPNQGGRDRLREPNSRTEYCSRQRHPPQRGKEKRRYRE